MNDPRRWLTCARCKKECEFDQVRYLADRSGVACKACLGIVEREHAERRKQEGKLFGFQCISCRYRFSRTANNKPEVCPQCGKREFIKFETEKLTASTILKIADDPRLDHLEI
jgi:DNA-directed RNA polymerase subunit RPC12/RpoP